MVFNESSGINLGNPNEFSISNLANMIRSKINPSLNLDYKKLPLDDPKQRKPDISLAKNKLKWEPKIDLEEGLEYTINYFKNAMN